MTAQQELGTRRTQGFLKSTGGPWVLLPKQSVSTPIQPLSKPGRGRQGRQAAALHGEPCVPCRPAEALFVCPGPSKALLSLLFTPCPGSMWVPGLTASPVTGRRSTQLSGHRGTRRHQCESLGLGVGGWQAGAPSEATFRSGGRAGLRLTCPLHLAGLGVPKCPHRDCPAGSSPQGTWRPAAESCPQ